MKTLRNSLLLTITLACCTEVLNAQEDASPQWNMMPGLVYVKHFPGDKLESRSYSGSGFNVRARMYRDDLPNLALTISGGIEWFYRTETYYYASPNSTSSGIATTMKGADFATYPFSVGVQAVLPSKNRDFMVFGGAEVALHFVNAEVDMRDQTKLGYRLLGGFSIKFFEIGAQYTAFSDMRNLGAYFGVRFSTFGMN